MYTTGKEFCVDSTYNIRGAQVRYSQTRILKTIIQQSYHVQIHTFSSLRYFVMAGKYLFSSLEPYKLTHIELTGIKLGHHSYASVVEVNYMGIRCAGKKIDPRSTSQAGRNQLYCLSL